MKKDNEKKNKFKNILKKIAKFLWNGLAVWGVVAWILLIVGACIDINSLHSNNNVNESSQNIELPSRRNIISNGVNYTYTMGIRSGFPNLWQTGIDTATLNYVITFTGDTQCVTIVNQGGSYYININLLDCVIYTDNSKLTGYNKLNFTMQYDGDDECVLYNINLRNNNNDVIYLWTRSGLQNNYAILCNGFEFDSSNIQPLPGRTFNYQSFLRQFFIIAYGDNISYSFNNYNVNPVQYYSYELMGDNTIHNTGSYTGHIDLDMYFVSNGVLYQKMRFQYDYVLGSWYNDTLTTYDNMTYLSLSYIAYQNTQGQWIKVAYPRIYKYETRTLNNVSQLAGYPFTDFNSYIWANDGYKDIIIVEGSQNIFSKSAGDPIANLTNIQVLTYEGEMNSLAVDVSNTNNVFVLLGEGFTSVASLFGIILLPGITIGTLLFLPLVVAIVLAIIKLLRK